MTPKAALGWIMILIALWLLLFALKAHAWEYNGTPTQVKSWKVLDTTLNPCERRVIDVGLKSVSGGLTPEQVEGTNKYIVGRTNCKAKTIRLANEGRRATYLHELGHVFDCVTGFSSNLIFIDAVTTDFQNMAGYQQAQNNYLADPREAFAELFAAEHLGESYYAQEYSDVKLFPTSQAVMDMMLQCKGE